MAADRLLQIPRQHEAAREHMRRQHTLEARAELAALSVRCLTSVGQTNKLQYSRGTYMWRRAQHNFCWTGMHACTVIQLHHRDPSASSMPCMSPAQSRILGLMLHALVHAAKATRCAPSAGHLSKGCKLARAIWEQWSVPSTKSRIQVSIKPSDLCTDPVARLTATALMPNQTCQAKNHTK